MGISPAFLSIGGGAAAPTCTLYYDGSGLTMDDNWQPGYNSSYAGPRYTPTENITVCKVDIYVDNISGTFTSSHDLYMYVGSIDGNDDIDAWVGSYSSKIDGDTITDADGWMSASAGFFEFSPNLSLSNGTTYVFTVFLDTDGNPTDSPETDGTNYLEWGIDNENNHAGAGAGQAGFIQHGWDAGGLPYADSYQDDEDDFIFRIYTMQ